MIKRPMLAAPTTEAELRAIKFPKLISAKVDGIRMLVIEREGKAVAVTRKFIEVPNRHIQTLFAREDYIGLDGELVLGNPYDKDCYRKTNSAAMTIDGTPDIGWYLFDSFLHPKKEYVLRAQHAKQFASPNSNVHWLPQVPVHSWEDILGHEEYLLNKGYEGAMLRDPRAPYKEGRSTVRQEWLLKVKRFKDSEAEVIGVTELQHNDNEATVDETGYTKRSTHKAGRTDAGTLGTLVARCVDKNDPFYGKEFEIGTGFTAEQRANLWEGRKYLPGKLVKYKYFPIGCKDKPRHPVFLGWRDRRDI